MQKFFTFTLILFFANLNALQADETRVSSVRIETEYNVVPSIDYGSGYYNGARFLEGWPEQTPILMTYVGSNSVVSVCSPDFNAKINYVYEYSQDMQYIRTLTFPFGFDKFGAFTKDGDGNFYFFHAKNVTVRNADNMIIERFNAEGEKTGEYRLRSNPPNSFSGIKDPFYCGSCRMEVSANNLAVYFARRMFDGHQASYGFVLDKNTFERIDTGAATNANVNRTEISQMPYVSHSFNQFILPIDGGFVFADHGDVYPRSFTFAKFVRGRRTARIHAFTFKKGGTYQNTFAQMGGLAKTTDGFLFAGTYENSGVVSHRFHNASRNLFVLTINDDLTSCGAPAWITNYQDKTLKNAAQPKIAEIGTNRFLLMWELMANNAYTTTYMKIIDQNGEPLSEEIELPGIRLNMNDVLRYNSATGKVYWAVNDGSKTIVVYGLDVGLG